MKKQVLKTAFIYFLIGATVNGSVYKLINYETYSHIMKHLILIAIMIVVALLFSYILHKNQEKKDTRGKV